MNPSLPQDVLDQIAQKILHFDIAPAAFLEGWNKASKSQVSSGSAMAPMHGCGKPRPSGSYD